jgi:signal transduction histidine kinase
MVSKHFLPGSFDATVVPNVVDGDEMDCIEEGSLQSSSRIKMSDANRLFLEKYRALDLAGQFEQSFPSFSDASIVKEYRYWNQKSVAVVTCVLSLVFVDFPYSITRFNLAYLGIYEHPFTISSQVVAIPTFMLFGMYVVVHLYLRYYGRNPDPNSASPDDDVFAVRKRWCDKFLAYPVEDFVVVGTTWMLSAIFLGRVSMGACPDNVSIWEAQRCNPVANSHSFPQDDVISMYGVPLFLQFLLRGTSLRGVLLSYGVAFAAVVYAMVAVEGYLQCYSILNLLVFPIMSVELERWMRVAFVRHKLVVESRETAIAAAENETKQVILSALAAQTAAENAAKILDLNNKAHLAAREQEMLRHIMGNVAHDMKTPLHSIFAELEGVRDAVGKACDDAAVPGADVSSILSGMKVTTDGTLDVVDSMAQFIVMSINRSQDYSKLTSNIALKPTLETVSVPDVLRFVTKCMAHQNCHRIINVHPMVSEICYRFCLRLGYCYD